MLTAATQPTEIVITAHVLDDFDPARAIINYVARHWAPPVHPSLRPTFRKRLYNGVLLEALYADDPDNVKVELRNVPQHGGTYRYEVYGLDAGRDLLAQHVDADTLTATYDGWLMEWADAQAALEDDYRDAYEMQVYAGILA